MNIKSILPNSRWNLVRSALVLAATVAAALQTPVLLIFPMSHAGLKTLDILIWLIFLADILFNFLSAYKEQTLLITDNKRIASRYLKGFFAADLLAALPPLLFAEQFFPWLRLLRLVKLIRLPALLRKSSISKLNPALGRMLKMVFWLLLASHFIACGFILSGGIPRTGNHGMEYLTSLYWTITTIATIGYGDITPDLQNPLLIIYTIITQLVGVGMYGFIIGNISSLIANLDIAKTQYRARMENVAAFIKEKRLPRDLAQQIDSYHEYIWETRRGQTDDSVVRELPDSLRAKVSLFLHKDILEKVPIFTGASEDFIEDIVHSLVPQTYLPGDRIVKAGDLGEDMYFISRGEVEVISPDEQIVYARLSTGNFFGEMALILSSPRTATIRACNYCDLYVLNKSSFEHVLAKYPDFAKSVRKMAEERKRANEGKKK